jgi:hypothetical protein
MVQIPDNMRPAVDLLAKYHFWLVALLVPLIVLPVLAAGNSGLTSRIATRRSEIESKLSQVRRVSGISPHPNENWSEAIEADRKRVQQDLMVEWKQLWQSQQQIRVWPEELGPDFLRRVQRLRPGEDLDRPSLINYQRRVPRFVQALPARMGAEEFMATEDGARDGARDGGGGRIPGRVGRGMGPGGFGGGPDGTGMLGPRPPITWNPADQQTLYESFLWDKPPSTIQALMAQEELWVYGVLCDILKDCNADATGAHDSAVAYVEELAVGYRAAEDTPGGAGRIYVPPSAGGGTGDEFDDMSVGMESEFGMDDGGAVGRPPHPRFGSSGSFDSGMRPGGEMGEMTRTLGSSDDDFLNWAYVDFSGKPLMAEELASAPGAAMVRLTPFLLRAVVDQRKLDLLLTKLGTWPIPIEVRQVRINPDAMAPDDGMSGGRGMGMGRGGMGPPRGGMGPPRGGMMGGGRRARDGAMGGDGGTAGSLRPHDVTVEILGTVALATPPGSKPPAASRREDDLGMRSPRTRAPRPLFVRRVSKVPLVSGEAS